MTKKRQRTAFHRPKALYRDTVSSRITIMVIQSTAVLFSTIQASSSYLSLQMSRVKKKKLEGVPIVAQQKQIRLRTLRLRVQSLAPLGGSRI